MLLRIVGVVAHFLHPLVESQEQLVMHLLYEENYVRSFPLEIETI